MPILLAAVDLSDLTPFVVSQTAILASALGAEVRLVHVAAPNALYAGLESGPDFMRDERAHELRKEHLHLERMAAEVRVAGVNVTPQLVQGPTCLLYTSPSPRDGATSRMPSSA